MLWHKAFSGLGFPGIKSDSHSILVAINSELLTDSLIIPSRMSSVGTIVSRGITIAQAASELASRSFLAAVVNLPKRNAIRTTSTARGSSSVRDFESEIAAAEIWPTQIPAKRVESGSGYRFSGCSSCHLVGCFHTISFFPSPRL